MEPYSRGLRSLKNIGRFVKQSADAVKALGLVLLQTSLFFASRERSRRDSNRVGELCDAYAEAFLHSVKRGNGQSFAERWDNIGRCFGVESARSRRIFRGSRRTY